jgi:hypothetical protein
MFHHTEFKTAFTTDVKVSSKQRLERLRVRKGTHAYVRLRSL